MRRERRDKIYEHFQLKYEDCSMNIFEILLFANFFRQFVIDGRFVVYRKLYKIDDADNVSYPQDEVVAVKDMDAPKGKIVIKAEDFSSWLVEDLKWNWGLTASFYDEPSIKLTSSNGIPTTSVLSNSKLDFSEVAKEKEKGLWILIYLVVRIRYIC